VDGVLDTVEMFDTWHGVWAQLPSMQVPRAGTASSPLKNKRILVVGGYTNDGITDGLLKSSEIYDPVARRWEFGADLCHGRWGHGVASLNDYVYVVGGCILKPGCQMQSTDSCEMYDSEANTWTEVAPLNMCRAGVRLVACRRNLVAVGGCDDVFGEAEMLNTCEIFDGMIWSLLDTRLSIPRTTCGVASIDGSLMIVGGAPNLKSTEMVVVESDNIVSTISSLAQGRMGCHAVSFTMPENCSYVHGSRKARRVVLVIGGEDAVWESPYERQFRSMEIYDIESQTWCHGPSMKTRRTAMAVCSGFGLAAPWSNAHYQGS